MHIELRQYKHTHPGATGPLYSANLFVYPDGKYLSPGPEHWYAPADEAVRGEKFVRIGNVRRATELALKTCRKHVAFWKLATLPGPVAQRSGRQVKRYTELADRLEKLLKFRGPVGYVECHMDYVVEAADPEDKEMGVEDNRQRMAR